MEGTQEPLTLSISLSLRPTLGRGQRRQVGQAGLALRGALHVPPAPQRTSREKCQVPKVWREGRTERNS